VIVCVAACTEEGVKERNEMKFDPAEMETAEVYKLMIRTIVPRPIAWVSTVSPDGVRNIAPFSFFTGITTDPPTVCFAPARKPGGVKKDTLANVEATGQFVINVVSENLAEAMNDTATDYPPEVDEFARAGLTPVDSEIVAPPRIGESPIHMECELQTTVAVGKKGGILVIGQVLLFHIDPRVVAGGKVDAGLLHAIGRLGGQEYARTSDRFVLERKKFRHDVS
jgi:flavin reductase (DIM6/NTAB) family NADH-FMN oxidoreductase RutF